MKRMYILKIVFDPETEEVEWLTEEVNEESDSTGTENGSSITIIDDPFEYLLEQMTREELLSLTSLELGIA